jgi:hypothetical protein
MIRDLLLIGSIMGLAIVWFVMKEGRYRNAGILILGTIAVSLLLTRNSNHYEQELSSILKETDQEYPLQQIPVEQLNPTRSFTECIKYYKMSEHPAALQLLKRIQDYREIVIKIAKERAGKGTIWRDSDEDVRVRSCLCGTLTRDEVIKALELQETPVDVPKVGAGMGMQEVLAGQPYRLLPFQPKMADDGKPAVRTLYDPKVLPLFQALIHSYPEAKEDLLAARTRYEENILRRLVGPRDGKGNPIVPLCRWRVRFDGSHYKEFEELEHKFMG